MKKKQITFISDTHGSHYDITKDLPGGWMLICSGDCSNTGKTNEINDFLGWFGSLPYEHKIMIAGNHDFGFEKYGKKEFLFPKGVTYLFDESVTIDGIKIYGSPWQPRFYDWAFNVDRGVKIAKKWDKIPDGVDILITHGPPYKKLDLAPRGEFVGCVDLLSKVMKIKPKIHAFGHIHAGYGIVCADNIIFINASSLNEMYEYANKPIIIDLKEIQNGSKN